MKPALLSTRIIGGALLVLALSACSALKLGYNNVQDIAYWWLDGYLDFDDAQSVRVRDDLARLHQWHRTVELPKLAQLLSRLEQQAAGDITPAQACEVITAVQERADALARQAEPAVVALARSVSPEQLRHLESRYARNDAQWRADWIQISPAERRDKRLKLVVERSEMIYGRLEEPQRTALRAQLDASAFDVQRVFVERQRRQQDALDTLRRVNAPGVTAEQARDWMRAYLERAQRSPDAGYRAYQQAMLQEGCRLFAAGHNASTPAQREVAVQRLRAYQRDLRELSTQR